MTFWLQEGNGMERSCISAGHCLLHCTPLLAGNMRNFLQVQFPSAHDMDIYLCACLLVCSFVVSLLFHYIQKMVYTLCITNFTFYTQLDFVVLHHLHPIMTLWHIIVSCIHYILSHAIDHISYIGSHCAIQYSTSIS